ncbi:MAG: 4'-phosphopantetheinyl transferase superfamily protein [Armatimonadetes bacterium]|nr:4'-phosphopantetheinyl transferase superfamily protein [Armatimonadota bacterium]
MVGRLLEIDPEAIDPGTSLRPLSNSMQSAKLTFALRSIGAELPAGVAVPDFAALERVLGHRSADVGDPVPAPSVVLPRSAPSAGVGIDIERVSELPVVPDYWEAPFYSGTFTEHEIATCITKGEARMHFAGCWCAKEALRKSRPDLAATSLSRIELSHHTDGAPYLRLLNGDTWEALPCGVSISHTSDLAVAVVVWPAPAQVKVRESAESPAPEPPMAPPQRPLRSSMLPTVLAFAALAISIYSLVRH